MQPPITEKVSTASPITVRPRRESPSRLAKVARAAKVAMMLSKNHRKTNKGRNGGVREIDAGSRGRVRSVRLTTELAGAQQVLLEDQPPWSKADSFRRRENRSKTHQIGVRELTRRTGREVARMLAVKEYRRSEENAREMLSAVR